MVCFKCYFLKGYKIFSYKTFFSVKFEDPSYGDNYIFEAIRLQGVM